MKTRNFKKIIFISVPLFLLFFPPFTFSGEWRVMPIRLEFDRLARSGVITIMNEGDEKINFQMKAFEWVQDSGGKDQYTETNDIIFFPRIMVVEKKQERILRAGIRIPVTAKEKTYRIFIEEIPGPRKEGEGVNVVLNIRFGVPIFLKPLKEDVKGEIEKIELSKGVFNAILKNKGNTHFIINSIDIKGKNLKGEEIFSRELSGWYLLSGISRPYSTPVPQEVCKDLAKLDIEVKTNRFNLNSKLDVDQEMCLGTISIPPLTTLSPPGR